MEAQKRVLGSRRPLSDCTNTDSHFSSSSAFKKCKSANTTPSANKSRDSGTFDYDISEPISVVYSRRHTSDKRNCNIASNPSSLPTSIVSTPTRHLKASSVAGTSNRDVSEPISVVYSRRHTSEKSKNKEKAVTIPFSITPVAKIFNNGEKSNDVEVVDLLKISTVPCRKKPRAMSSEQDVSNHDLLEDFINKQKAYFDEIDEFKVPVEEVDSAEELE